MTLKLPRHSLEERVESTNHESERSKEGTTARSAYLATQ